MRLKGEKKDVDALQDLVAAKFISMAKLFLYNVAHLFL